MALCPEFELRNASFVSPCVPATHLCLQEDIILSVRPVESHSKPSLASLHKRMVPQRQFPVKGEGGVFAS